MARLRAWAHTSRMSRVLIAASLIDSIGTGLYVTGSAEFFTRALGLSAGEVGAGLSLSGIAGVLSMVPLGRLAGRAGSRRTLIALFGWRGACFAVFPFAHAAAAFFTVAFLIGTAEWSCTPIVQSIVGAAEGTESRVRVMAMIYSVRNTGFALGAVLATLAVATGSPQAFRGLVFADAATFFAAAALLSRLPAAANMRAGRQPAGSVLRAHNPRFLALTVGNGVLYLHSILLTVGLPLWIITHTTAPPALIGVVLVINTVLVTLFQVPLSRGAENARGGAQRALWASWCLAGCCLFMASTAGAGKLVASVLVLVAAVPLTLGEIWQAVGGWRLSYALAPEDQRPYYLSVFQLGVTGANVIGPALVTAAVIHNGASGWVGMATFFLLSGVAMVLLAAQYR